MFSDLLNEMSNGLNESMSISHLLHKLEQEGFEVEHYPAASLLTAEDVADVWDEYLENPASAVNYLETKFGFIFTRKEQNESSSIGLKDWNKLVLAAKEAVEEYGVEEAAEHLAKTFSFLNMFEIEKLIDQVVE